MHNNLKMLNTSDDLLTSNYSKLEYARRKMDSQLDNLDRKTDYTWSFNYRTAPLDSVT